VSVLLAHPDPAALALHESRQERPDPYRVAQTVTAVPAVADVAERAVVRVDGDGGEVAEVREVQIWPSGLVLQNVGDAAEVVGCIPRRSGRAGEDQLKPE
jgi:hypothetical protein